MKLKSKTQLKKFIMIRFCKDGIPVFKKAEFCIFQEIKHS